MYKILTTINTLKRCKGRLLFFIFISNLILISPALGHGQAMRQLITVDFKNVTIKGAFKELNSRVGLKFVYSPKDLDENRKVSGKFVDKSTETVINFLLSGLDVTYSIKDNTVVIKKTEPSKPQTLQQRTIKGQVLDEKGNPMPGVTVRADASSHQAVTDDNGNFNIAVAANDKQLHFSLLGQEQTNVNLTSEVSYTVRMASAEQGLDEVVVVGYGTQAKKDLTGSVSTIKGSTIQERRSMQLSSALQGTVSGVMVNRTNGAPGSGGSIKIRGITTIGNSDPLIIVDGVPAYNIDDINPDDVESMSVLKDAASASIYGARAASGVIVITTKRGKTGKIDLSYSAEFGMEKPTRNPQYTEVTRFMEMANELTWNDAGNGNDEYAVYPKNIISDYYDLNRENPDEYPLTDWYDIMTRGTAPRQSHIVSISGGNESIRSKASVIYNNMEGLYSAKRSLDRFTARLNNDFKIGKMFDAALDVSYKKSQYQSPAFIPNNELRTMPPIYPAIWENGTTATGKSGFNPYAALMYGGRNKTLYDQLAGNGKVNFKPMEGLTITAAVAATYGFDKIKDFTQRVPYYIADNPNTVFGYVDGHTRTNLTENRNDNHTITKQLYANYVKDIGKHSLGGMIGYEDFYGFNEDLSAFKDEFELSNFPYLSVGPDNVLTNSGNAVEHAYQSVFGRVIYNYDKKYLFQANIRRDGSSRFAPGHRWGNFPSLSAGWVISEENFMKKVTLISFLKLRASYGSLGNERIGNYPYQTLLNYSNTLFYEGDKAVSKTTAAQWQYAIRDISWETTTSLDVGLDASLLNDRLSLSFDYYDKQTKDMLLAIKIPSFVGYDNPEQNTGKMYTKGYDIEIGWRDKIGALGYSISGNLSDFKSRMGDLGGTQFLGDQIKTEGSEFNEWYGYVSQGIYQTVDEVANSPRLNDNVKPGDIRYKDISGPDGVPDGKISPEYDRVLLGGSLPQYLYGINFTFDYSGFDLALTLQGVGKQTVKKNHMVVAYSDAWKNMPKIIDGKYWSNYNTPEVNESAEYPRLTRTAISNNNALSDFWLFNGGYHRLKNITLGYTIPSHIVNTVNIANLRVYASLNDLFSIDKYPQGWDPEMSGLGSYPITASYVLGLSLRF